jgi:hypothetical protein
VDEAAAAEARKEAEADEAEAEADEAEKEKARRVADEAEKEKAGTEEEKAGTEEDKAGTEEDGSKSDYEGVDPTNDDSPELTKPMGDWYEDHMTKGDDASKDHEDYLTIYFANQKSILGLPSNGTSLTKAKADPYLKQIDEINLKSKSFWSKFNPFN